MKNSLNLTYCFIVLSHTNEVDHSYCFIMFCLIPGLFCPESIFFPTYFKCYKYFSRPNFILCLLWRDHLVNSLSMEIEFNCFHVISLGGIWIGHKPIIVMYNWFISSHLYDNTIKSSLKVAFLADTVFPLNHLKLK